MIYLGNQPIGVAVKQNNFITQDVNISLMKDNEEWVRPSDWPDIDSLNLTMSGDDYIYMLYDKIHDNGLIQWGITTADQEPATFDIGHIENGEFIVDETTEVEDGGGYIRNMNDLDGYVILRVTGQIKTCKAGLVSYNSRIQDRRSQPLLERIAWVPHLTSFCANATAEAWGMHTLQHEVVGNGENNALTSLYYAYTNCYALQSLDISNLYTQNVVNLTSVFNGCRNLKTLDLKHWDISNCALLGNTFATCRSLKTIDLTGWDVSKVTSFESMFNDCVSLNTILGLEGFETTSATSMANMFNGCHNIKYLPVENFNTAKVTSLSGMFNNCFSLISLDLSTWDVGKVINLSSLFYGCVSLSKITFGPWKTGTLQSVSSLFRDCQSLKDIDVSWLKITSACSSMAYLFANCYSVERLDIPSDWDVSGIGNSTTGGMSIFSGCFSLQTITGIEHWSFTSACSLNATFYNCRSLKNLDIDDWDVSGVNNFGGMFQNCYSLQELDLSSWEPGALTTCSNMFNACYSLRSIGDISNFDTENVTTLASMFQNCYSLQEFPDIEDWDVAKVTTTVSMFSGCRALTEITLKNWDLAACTTIATMFRYCDRLKKATLTGWSLPKLTATSPAQFLADCYNLRDLTIDLPIKLNLSYANCTNLSYDSLIGILDNLPTVTTSRTITLSSNLKSSLTDTEIAVATSKGWTVA